MFEFEESLSIDKKRLVLTSSVVTFVVLLTLYISVSAFYNYRSSTSIVSEQISQDSQNPNNLSELKEIYVDLAGSVNKPGIYKISDTSRVADLIALGEGISSTASSEWLQKNLNLSEKLVDSQKIYIPFEWEILKENAASADVLETNTTPVNVGVSPITAIGLTAESENPLDKALNSTKINLNSASQLDLETLSGIGKVYAQKIILGRPYDNLTDLVTKGVISESLVEKIQDYVTF